MNIFYENERWPFDFCVFRGVFKNGMPECGRVTDESGNRCFSLWNDLSPVSELAVMITKSGAKLKFRMCKIKKPIPLQEGVSIKSFADYCSGEGELYFVDKVERQETVESTLTKEDGKFVSRKERKRVLLVTQSVYVGSIKNCAMCGEGTRTITIYERDDTDKANYVEDDEDYFVNDFEEMKLGTLEGQRLKSREIQTGRFNLLGLQGKGEIEFNYGDWRCKLEGEFIDGETDSEVKITELNKNKNGILYEGFTSRCEGQSGELPNGYGVLTTPDATYSGEFAFGELWGDGVLVLKDFVELYEDDFNNMFQSKSNTGSSRIGGTFNVFSGKFQNNCFMKGVAFSTLTRIGVQGEFSPLQVSTEYVGGTSRKRETLARYTGQLIQTTDVINNIEKNFVKINKFFIKPQRVEIGFQYVDVDFSKGKERDKLKLTRREALPVEP